VSGASLPLHLALLNDRRRTTSFLDTIATVVRPGDVVVDVGTGTGVLALAAARAGARHVYAIEMGGIADCAEGLFEASDASDRITLVRGRSLDVRLPERADVLVCELIGHAPLA
jgi:predicted RNA methylase